MTTDSQAILVPRIQQLFAKLKETEKGQKEMTEALAQLVEKGKLEVIETVVRNMAADGFSFDQIVRLTGAPAGDVQKIMDNIAIGSQAQLS